MISTVGTTAAILGAILVMLDRSAAANGLWMISNPLLIYHNYLIGDMEQTRMFCIFFAAALLGVFLAFRNRMESKKAAVGPKSKAAERALVLNEAVRAKGFLKRRDASSLLECCHSESLRAMQEAASMFDDLCVKKNTSNGWVLAVVSA